ncbi:MAG: DUF2490 domain-containing protein [Phenylobacterium zucineum]|nr:MAG: DUF2490 domain-containing protein [Phenylobacterium zucineum]
MPRPSRHAHGLLTFLCGAVATAIAAPAAAMDDTQAWGAVLANGPVRGDLFLWLEGQARATDDLGGGSQIIIRPAVGARIAPDAHAVAGYAYVRTDPEDGRTTNEHRIWQQVQFAPVRGPTGAPRIISRTRLEQRIFEGRDDTGWRLRQLVRFQAPITRQGAVQAIVFTEGFVNFNSTDWGARDGLDQWRTFVGVGLPVRTGVRLEAGYLNQHIFRRGEDRDNHALSATVVMAL